MDFYVAFIGIYGYTSTVFNVELQKTADGNL